MKRKIFSKLLMGALLVASVSSFVSCKDYDDDIQKNADAISSLTATVQNLQSALDAAKAQAATDHATFALKTQVAADIAAAVKGLATEEAMAKADKANADAIAALQELVKTLATADALEAAKKEAQDALAKAQAGNASKEDLDKVSVAVSAINSELDDIKTALNEAKNAGSDNATAIAAATKNIEAQQKAIETLQAALNGKASTADLNALKTQLAAKADASALTALENKVKELESVKTDLEALKKTAEQIKTLDELKETMKKADDAINKIAPKVNLLTVFITKQLRSLVFLPEFYSGGIEAIEVPALIDQAVFVVDATDTRNHAPATGAELLAQVNKNNGNMIAYTPNTYAVLANAKTVDFFPAAIANYHANPSTADLTGATASFISNIVTAEKTIPTRGDNYLAKPVNAALSNANLNDGILSVPFTISWRAIHDRNSRGNYEFFEDPNYPTVPMVALEVAVSDTTVVSDYAMVQPTQYANLILADKNYDKQTANGRDDGALYDTHLNQNLTQVIAEANTNAIAHELVYNDANGLNLNNYIQTHYDYKGVDDAVVAADLIMSAAQLNSLGLHYEYTPISYTLGANRTNESAHIEIINGVAYARSVNADGSTIKGATATEEAVDRLPVIRVTLVDANGTIYNYGYLKIKIVRAQAASSEVPFSFTGNYYLNCDLSAQMTWAEVENAILAKVGMSKSDFEMLYQLETAGGNAVQYVNVDGTYKTVAAYAAELKAYYDKQVNSAAANNKAGVANSANAAIAALSIGTVQYTTADASDSHTNVFKWTATTAGTARAATGYGSAPTTGAAVSNIANIKSVAGISNGVSTKDVTTIVRFKKATTTGGTLEDGSIYVALTIPAGKIFSAATSVQGKVLGQWYQLNSNAQASSQTDAKEVRVNVPSPDQHTANLTQPEFKKELSEFFLNANAVFRGNQITGDAANDKLSQFDGVTASYKLVLPKKDVNATFSAGENKFTGSSNTASAKYNNSWVVNGWSGAQYILVVDGTSIKAKAQLNGRASDIDVVIVTLNNATTGEIQYDPADNDVAKDILNYVGHDKLGERETFTAYIQVTPSATCYPMDISNDYFNVRFLRPVNTVAASGATFTDATNAEQVKYLYQLLTVTDWRDYPVVQALSWNSTTNGTTTTYSRKDSKEVLYDYYGLKISTTKADILTDIALPESQRIDGRTDFSGLQKVGDVPALASTVNVVDRSITRRKTSTSTESVTVPAVTYVNNSGNVQKFHLYIPIKIDYLWGKDTQAVKYAVITVQKTESNSRER